MTSALPSTRARQSGGDRSRSRGRVDSEEEWYARLRGEVSLPATSNREGCGRPSRSSTRSRSVSHHFSQDGVHASERLSSRRSLSRYPSQRQNRLQSGNRGTEDTSRRELIAQLVDVDAAMARVLRPSQQLAAPDPSRVPKQPLSPKKQGHDLPPPYHPQLLKKSQQTGNVSRSHINLKATSHSSGLSVGFHDDCTKAPIAGILNYDKPLKPQQPHSPTRRLPALSNGLQPSAAVQHMSPARCHGPARVKKSSVSIADLLVKGSANPSPHDSPAAPKLVQEVQTELSSEAEGSTTPANCSPTKRAASYELPDPTPPRALPDALQPLPKGPFAFQAASEHRSGPVTCRTQSLPTSPEPTRAPLPRWAAQQTFNKAPGLQSREAYSSDWEEAGQWLEPTAPGAVAALKSALAALGSGPSASKKQPEAHALPAPQTAPATPRNYLKSSRRSSAHAIPWTPAGAPPMNVGKRWYDASPPVTATASPAKPALEPPFMRAQVCNDTARESDDDRRCFVDAPTTTLAGRAEKAAGWSLPFRHEATEQHDSDNDSSDLSQRGSVQPMDDSISSMPVLDPWMTTAPEDESSDEDRSLPAVPPARRPVSVHPVSTPQPVSIPTQQEAQVPIPMQSRPGVTEVGDAGHDGHAHVESVAVDTLQQAYQMSTLLRGDQPLQRVPDLECDSTRYSSSPSDSESDLQFEPRPSEASPGAPERGQAASPAICPQPQSRSASPKRPQSVFDPSTVVHAQPGSASPVQPQSSDAPLSTPGSPTQAGPQPGIEDHCNRSDTGSESTALAVANPAAQAATSPTRQRPLVEQEEEAIMDTCHHGRSSPALTQAVEQDEIAQVGTMPATPTEGVQLPSRCPSPPISHESSQPQPPTTPPAGHSLTAAEIAQSQTLVDERNGSPQVSIGHSLRERNDGSASPVPSDWSDASQRPSTATPSAGGLHPLPFAASPKLTLPEARDALDTPSPRSPALCGSKRPPEACDSVVLAADGNRISFVNQGEMSDDEASELSEISDRDQVLDAPDSPPLLPARQAVARRLVLDEENIKQEGVEPPLTSPPPLPRDVAHLATPVAAPAVTSTVSVRVPSLESQPPDQLPRLPRLRIDLDKLPAGSQRQAPRLTTTAQPASPAQAPVDAPSGAPASLDTVASNPIGAAMLSLQPAMGGAAVADVVAAMGQGTVMHKAWIHTAAKPLTGSKRTIRCTITGFGATEVSYTRGMLRGSKAARVNGILVMGNKGLAVETASGTLVLTLPDERLHALWVLGFCAVIAMACGAASPRQLLADIPWASKIRMKSS